MPNDMPPADDAFDSFQNEEDEALAKLRWEKDVEFALARELQTWHIVSQSKLDAKANLEPAKGKGTKCGH